MTELVINEEFKRLIPSLSTEEMIALERSIIAEGCRDPLVTWNGYIIDGHHRYGICQKYNIEFTVVNKPELESELDVKLWMINNQFSRRNLSIAVRLDLAFQFKEFEQEKAKNRQLSTLKNNSKNKTLDRSDLTYREETGKSLEAVAKMAETSYGTAFKYEKLIEKAPNEIKQEVIEGKVSIDRAYRNLQKAERLEANKVTEWPEGKYRVIYADPPWSYGDERSGMGGAIDHYNTMSLENIKDLSVKELAEDNAVLFMWATAPLLEEAFEVVNAWGFKYKTNIIWNKVKPNLGNYTSVRHEHLIIATKGSCTPDNTQRFNSVQTIERTGRHSEKPEEFRNIIETLYTYGNKIELFSRKKVEGWEVYGNEC